MSYQPTSLPRIPSFGETLSRNAVCILGIPIDQVSADDAARQIRAAAAQKRRLFVSTANLNFLALSRESEAFRQSLRASDLCTADGVAVVKICELLGVRLPGRVTGADMLEKIAETSDGASPPLSVFIFGGTPEAARGAHERINAAWPQRLRSEGHLSPAFADAAALSGPDTLGALALGKPDFLVVALGAAKGQEWIMRNLPHLEAPVVSHLGATVNFLAGTIRRAPRAVQRVGFEWLWRILQEPRLAGRYAHDGSAVGRMMLSEVLPLRAWLRAARRQHGDVSLNVSERQQGDRVELTVEGAITRATAPRFRQALGDAMSSGAQLETDLSRVTWMDCHGMGLMLLAHKAAFDSGRSIKFHSPSAQLATGLRLNGLSPLVAGGFKEHR